MTSERVPGNGELAAPVARFRCWKGAECGAGQWLRTSWCLPTGPVAFLFTEDDLLAEVLLRWNDLTDRQKKDVLKQVEGATASSAMRRQRK